MTEMTDADISGTLKTVYAGWREKLFPLSTPLLANLEKGKAGGLRNMRWGGSGVNFDAVMEGPAGMTASISGYLPPHHAAQEKQGTIDIKRLYVSRQIDGLAINGTMTKEQAYISLARKVLEEAKQAARLGMQEICHGNGLGIKAVVQSFTDNDTFVVAAPYGIAGAGQGGLLLRKGMYVEVLNSTGATSKGKSFITSVTSTPGSDNATIQLTTAAASNGGVANGDLLVAATVNDHSYGAFPNGLANMLNRGAAYDSIHGLASTTYARWNRGAELTAGTHVPDNPTEMDIWELMAIISGVSGHDATLNPREFLLLGTPGIEKKVAESFLGQRRFLPENTLKIKGGWSAVQIFGVPFVRDAWCPAGTVYLVHLPSMSWVDAKDWGQVQYESAGAWRWIDGRDAFQINWAAYLNLACPQRNSHGSIVGYTDAGRYSHVM